MVQIRTREIFNDSRFMLIAVESVNYHHTKTDSGGWLYGSIKPIAIIVCSADAIYALDILKGPEPFNLQDIKTETEFS